MVKTISSKGLLVNPIGDLFCIQLCFFSFSTVYGLIPRTYRLVLTSSTLLSSKPNKQIHEPICEAFEITCFLQNADEIIFVVNKNAFGERFFISDHHHSFFVRGWGFLM